MTHKHEHDKHGKGAHPKGSREKPIGMVKQRASLATILAFGIVGLVVLAILTVIAYWLFN